MIPLKQEKQYLHDLVKQKKVKNSHLVVAVFLKPVTLKIIKKLLRLFLKIVVTLVFFIIKLVSQITKNFTPASTRRHCGVVM